MTGIPSSSSGLARSILRCVRYERDRWSLRLFSEDLTNVRRFSGLAFDNLAFGADGNHYGPLEAPRVIGAELERKF
ncbi:hypothetical protein PX554_19580 [Sphingomonas sp. H39-1-10]|uniref:hypothetical protein n=1 Tax=Sphingomonas pollutisoli TaxID=3030829 RepID=UPI0023B8BCFC|nr:hypothetical protein [Sphingomonas pollutisoli]MDF0490332.1 hypothetical protein [Sphingomonas pollutisoli]